VLDDQQGTAAVDELSECGEELGNIVEVQAGGGLVENVERAAARLRSGVVGAASAAGARGSEMRGELDALGLSAGERSG